MWIREGQAMTREAIGKELETRPSCAGVPRPRPVSDHRRRPTVDTPSPLSSPCPRRSWKRADTSGTVETVDTGAVTTYRQGAPCRRRDHDLFDQRRNGEGPRARTGHGCHRRDQVERRHPRHAVEVRIGVSRINVSRDRPGVTSPFMVARHHRSARPRRRGPKVPLGWSSCRVGAPGDTPCPRPTQ